jgi:molybdate/tungstate transport system substrate-binding protein
VLDGPEEEPPKALVAGSLLSLAEQVDGATVEARGSVAVRRQVLEGVRDPDVVGLADPRLFDGISDRATLFATNALVVAYDPDSEHAPAIREDWRAALASEAIEVGRTDPDTDPLGYRAVLALRLAERDGDVDADTVLEDSRVLPEVDLLNVLEGGGLDAALAYRSMAVERGLPTVDLPVSIDFSDPEHADHYGSVAYDLPKRTVRGAPIRYGAAALTMRGEGWLDRLVSGHDRLRASGFEVPAAYPRRDVSVR